jgi:hypothetical protein
MGVLNLQQVPAGTGASRQGEALGLLAQLIHPMLQNKFKQQGDVAESDRAATGLDEILNKPRQIETASPSEVETQNAQAAMSAPKPLSLSDIVKPQTQSAPEELPKMLNIPEQPLATMETDKMPAPQTAMLKPKPGDEDYQVIPKGLPASTYGTIATRKMAPTIGGVMGEMAADGDYAGIADISKAKRAGMTSGSGDLIKITDAQGNNRVVSKSEAYKNGGDTGVNSGATHTAKAEVVKGADGKERVMNMFYNAKDPGQPPIQGGEVRDPLTVSMARAEAFAKAKPYPTLDAYDNYRPVVLTWGQADSMNVKARAAGQPDRYVPVGPTTSALEKTALVADMQRTIDRVRETLPAAKFDTTSAAQATEMMRSINDREAFSRMLQYGVGRTLTPGQRDYLVALAQLQENSLALRSVLKAGPGSDQLREKILATLPSGSTPDMEYATEQINQYESMLQALGRGIPSATLNAPGRIGEGTKPAVTKPGSLPTPPKPPTAAPNAGGRDLKNMSTEELLRMVNGG